MFFNQGVFNGTFDSNYIEKFSELLAAQVSDVEIVWKEGRHVADSGDMADSATVTVNGRTVMGISSHKNKGFVNLKNIEGYEEIVYNAQIDSQVMDVYDKPSYSTGIMCSIGHALLLIFLTGGRSEMAPFIWISFAVLILSVVFMYIALQGKWGSTARIAISVLSCIGLLCLAPGSLLQMPLFIAINKNYIYNEARKCYKGASWD